MRRKIELLAPGGDVDSIKAAIVAGADAVFCGLNKFNARNRAANISFDDLQGIIRLAHKHNCEVFLTLNILILESEITELISVLNKLVNTSIDGVIVQDLGMFYLLNKYFENLKIHASTQLTTHNKGQIQFLSRLNASRVNLSRELSIAEIKELSDAGQGQNMLTEVFVHGSYCLSFSGICYMSSVHGGRSGNRGRCSQPCRERYITTASGKNFPLNLKDNSAYFDLKELYNAGADSLKIEGRIKEYDYVYSAVNTWRKQIDYFLLNDTLLGDNTELYKVFNRDFSNGFLKGDIGENMFIDNPMSNSTNYLSAPANNSSETKHKITEHALYAQKEASRRQILNEIEQMDIGKIPVKVSISGKAGQPLKIVVQTPTASFTVQSEVNLTDEGTEVLTEKMVLKRIKAINDTEYFIEHINSDQLGKGVYLPFKQLTSIKKQLLCVLNDANQWIPPQSVPKLKNRRIETKPKLSVLISSENDLHLCETENATIYYQLPNSIGNTCDKLVALFQQNKKLIPWFPPVLIGNDYKAALEFLKKLKPKQIVTNNSGIAYESFINNIDWIAGPFLNTSNSFALLCLKEHFNCSGAFISNELSKIQIQNIKKPADFELHYSIYHPIVLMTSRQCLSQQLSGCAKNKLDDACVENCVKRDTVTNLKEETFFIEKEPGNYHSVYSEANFLNTKIVADIPNLFSGFLIDLRDIKTKTEVCVGKSELTGFFESYISGSLYEKDKLKEVISIRSNFQYKKGI